MKTRTGTHLLSLLVICLVQMIYAPHAAAEEAEPQAAPTPGAEKASSAPASNTPPPPPEAAPADNFVSSHNIGDNLGEARKRRSSLFNLGLRDASLRFERRLYKKTNVRVAGMYTLLYQEASTGVGPRQAAGADVDVIATWDAIRRGGKTVGALAAAFEGRYKVWTDIPPSSLSNTFDSLWTTVSGFNVQNFVPTQIYWNQSLLRDRLRFQVGKLSPYSTFFGNRINSSNLFFVNYAFADNPAVFMPGNGLGLHVSYELSPQWTVYGGLQDANGVKTEVFPDTLKFGEFWYALQVNYEAKIRGLGTGTWRLGAWYTQPRSAAGTPGGAGTVLSIDQELGKKVIGFLRYEWQGASLLNPEVRFEALTATRSALRFGVGLPGPFKRLPDDFMGLAVAWGAPAQTSARDSFVGEYFYRFQLESSTQLSFSLQAIRSSTVFKDVYVLSLRMRFEF